MEQNALVEWQVEGMTCTGCANTVKIFLESHGLKNVQVNYSTKEVIFAQPDGKLDIQEISQGLKGLGYHLVLENEPEPFWTLKRKTIFSLIFTLPLLILHLLPFLGIKLPSTVEDGLIPFLICLPVFILGFLHFGQTAWTALRLRTFHMDALIFIGGTSAFVYSCVGVWTADHNLIFFETCASIFTLVFIGNWIESRSVEKTTHAINDLSALQVEKAKMVMGDSNFIWVDRHELRVGDFLQINEGDPVPTDGLVIKGQAYVDESMISGESHLVHKTIGDSVVGATICRTGHFQLKVTAVGKSTVLSRIVDLVKNAQLDKPPIQRLADQISGIFVPTILIFALLTLGINYYLFNVAFSQSLLRAIAVLVISCPCAMGLATPTAIMVGVGRLAKQGVLIKGGRTLEDFGRIKAIVFDKTGTLTSAEARVESIEYSSMYSAGQINDLIKQLEHISSHPLAHTLTVYVQNQPQESWPNNLLDKREIKGKGILASDDLGNAYGLGSSALLKHPSEPGTHVFLSMNDTILAKIFFTETLKHDAQRSIQYFNDLGIKTVLLSGDHPEKVSKVQNKLLLQEAKASQSPEDKLRHLDQLQQNQTVAMVGDGINDAPALQKASVGIALNDASKIAMQSAKIIILEKNLGKLVWGHQISRLTLTTIKENLFWAFGYNLVAIPIAALGFLNPMWGAAFMAFSDLVVIGNSLRLRHRKV